MTNVRHEFVEFVPELLDEKVLYVSIKYSTAVHKCVCGCGNEVVTPLSPTDWKLTFDGKTVSLYPSIGNWNFKCQSHYWIKNSKIDWATKWSKEQIKRNRDFDAANKNAYHKANQAEPAASTVEKLSLWQKIKKLLW